MKKTVLISLAAVAIVAAAVWNVTQSTTSQSNEFDALTLANIEALTDGEEYDANKCLNTYSYEEWGGPCSAGYEVSFIRTIYSCSSGGSDGGCTVGYTTSGYTCDGPINEYQLTYLPCLFQ